MNSAFRFVLLPLFFCLASALPAGGGREKDAVVQVSGRVRLVGSGAMPELVISGPVTEWHIEKNEEYKLMDLQQRNVTVEGIETVRALRFANGSSAGERRTLKNIRIVSVDT